MRSSLTLDELKSHRHPAFPVDDRFVITRYEIDVDPDSQGVTEIVLFLRSNSGSIRRFRFTSPSFSEFGPLSVPLGLFTGPIYVADIKFKGWDYLKVEVGSLAEECPTFFFAEKIEEIT